MREFKCNRCGVCCKHVADVEEAEFLDRGDGVWGGCEKNKYNKYRACKYKTVCS